MVEWQTRRPQNPVSSDVWVQVPLPRIFLGPQQFRQGAELRLGVGGVVPARRGKMTSANNTVHYDHAMTAQVAAA